jgi:hypothetical protein
MAPSSGWNTIQRMQVAKLFGTYVLDLYFEPEEGSSNLFRNVSKLSEYTSYPSHRTECGLIAWGDRSLPPPTPPQNVNTQYSAPWEPQILHIRCESTLLIGDLLVKYESYWR